MSFSTHPKCVNYSYRVCACLIVTVQIDLRLCLNLRHFDNQDIALIFARDHVDFLAVAVKELRGFLPPRFCQNLSYFVYSSRLIRFICWKSSCLAHRPSRNLRQINKTFAQFVALSFHFLCNFLVEM